MLNTVQDEPPTLIALAAPRPTYTASDFTRAARRCTELAGLHPSWPQARVQRVVAWEMEIRTTTLRYLLRQAAGCVKLTLNIVKE